MPSPFPGMDPFLEHPDIFPDFHDSFIAYLRETIQQGLPAGYVAGLGRRAWIEVSERYIGRDVPGASAWSCTLASRRCALAWLSRPTSHASCRDPSPPR